MVGAPQVQHVVSKVQQWWNDRQASRAEKRAIAEAYRLDKIVSSRIAADRIAKAEAKRQRRTLTREVAVRGVAPETAQAWVNRRENVKLADHIAAWLGYEPIRPPIVASPIISFDKADRDDIVALCEALRAQQDCYPVIPTDYERGCPCS